MRYGLTTRLEPVHQWSGASDRPAPIVALHGFTGSGEDFGPLAPLLEREFLAPDLPGHGGAQASMSAASYSMERAVGGLAELLDRRAAAPAVFMRPVLLGYSMGGRIALSFAAAFPERLAALVLVGASPGLADEEARAARRAADSALADRIEAEGVLAFAERWAKHPIIASQARITQPYLREMRRRRLGNRPWGLANSLRGVGTGAMPSVWGALPDLRVPTLLLTGEEDLKFRGIAREMRALMPEARHEVIPGAGHCAHLERPEATAAAIQTFLDAISSEE